MIKLALRHFLTDTALSVFFDALQTNLITTTMTPIVDGGNVRVDTPSYTLEIMNVGGDTNECIRFGKILIAQIIYMDAHLIVDFLANNYNLEAHIHFK
jgi:hypothetical protein